MLKFVLLFLLIGLRIQLIFRELLVVCDFESKNELESAKYASKNKCLNCFQLLFYAGNGQAVQLIVCYKLLENKMLQSDRTCSKSRLYNRFKRLFHHFRGVLLFNELLISFVIMSYAQDKWVDTVFTMHVNYTLTL